MPTDEKYIVFKRQEFYEMMADLEDKGQGIIVKAIYSYRLPDAMVIRHNDIFAPAVFYSYAASVRSLMELASDTGVPLTADQRQKLQRLADHFASAADHAATSNTRKIPD